MVNICTSRSWIEIDLDAISYNIKQLSRLLKKQSKIMAVVKGDGYGHGLVEIARYCQKIGIDAFAVATIDEAIKLRQQGITGDILILGYTHPVRGAELHNYRLIQTVISEDHAYQLNKCGYNIDVHIKIDTGMHRLGLKAERLDKIEEIYNYQFINIQGFYTHFCVCDSKKKSDVDFTKKQIKRFFTVIEVLKSKYYKIGKIHLQSSYGLVNYPEVIGDYARIGILMYGVHTSSNAYLKSKIDLKPALSIKSRVARLHYLSKGTRFSYGLTYKVNHDSVIAVVPTGYGDGLPRNLSLKGSVIIKGQKCSIVGRMCMDQMFVDVSNIEDISDDDEVIIIGQEGNEVIGVEDLALVTDTISNEILTHLNSRLPRIYKGGK